MEEKKVFEFLNELRDSGAVNMLGATDYIMEEFLIEKKEARKLLMKWMKM